MKLGMTVGMRGNDPRAFAQYARRLEDAGVEYLWTGEATTPTRCRPWASWPR